MATVKFKETNQGDGLVATVDLVQPLRFDSDGLASLDLNPGTHFLFWSAFGPPAAKVTMQITEPSSAKFSHSDTIGAQMQNSWSHQFEVAAAAGAEVVAAPTKVHASMKKFVVLGNAKKKGGK